jgi:hypothetical protein
MWRERLLLRDDFLTKRRQTSFYIYVPSTSSIIIGGNVKIVHALSTSVQEANSGEIGSEGVGRRIDRELRRIEREFRRRMKIDVGST